MVAWMSCSATRRALIALVRAIFNARNDSTIPSWGAWGDGANLGVCVRGLLGVDRVVLAYAGRPCRRLRPPARRSRRRPGGASARRRRNRCTPPRPGRCHRSYASTAPVHDSRARVVEKDSVAITLSWASTTANHVQILVGVNTADHDRGRGRSEVRHLVLLRVAATGSCGNSGVALGRTRHPDKTAKRRRPSGPSRVTRHSRDRGAPPEVFPSNRQVCAAACPRRRLDPVA